MSSLRTRLIYDRRLRIALLSCFAALIILSVIAAFIFASQQNTTSTKEEGVFRVVNIIDGDTIRVRRGTSIEKIRLIGIDTPETVDSRVDVQCYGPEATQYLKQKLENKEVVLISDVTQGDTDKYGRLLRYVSLGGEDVGLDLIRNGYAKEYTYEKAYSYQSAYRDAQILAKSSKLGVWSDKCSSNDGKSSQDSQPQINPVITPEAKPAESSISNCNIKGNISYYDGKKIYHVPGQKYYESTQIDESAGERWFCSEAEAQAAGWRKSKE